ncbi:hypothetical protein H6G17_11855 [Chroococcidiopsis sp. FACHB-1243]|nr:hypothetical protein [Chroococcidiopsis sp. [FACHB-1243]]MBD2306208.1 hypothetical protein [Chroococcidiopsis sp. [FACHB-1243]]
MNCSWQFNCDRRSLVTARYLLSSIFLNNTTTATDYDRDRFCYHST